MHKRASMLILFFFILCAFFGCAPRIVKSELDQLFEKNFEGFAGPEVSWIKQGVSQNFPHATYDQVWDAAILQLIQQGIIVRLSMNDGVIVAVSRPPLAIYVERGEIVTAYLNWMSHLDYLPVRYRKANDPNRVFPVYTPENMRRMAETFFGKLATQLYASRKWGYLIKLADESERAQQEVSTEKVAGEEVSRKEIFEDSGIISITSDPPGAKIFIDGEFKGQTPAEISLPIGTYQIFLQRQLYESYKDLVMIEKGQTKTLNIKLSSEGKE